MSIMDFFKQGTQQQKDAQANTPANQQPNPANLNTQQNGVTASNGTTPEQDTSASPLAQFADLWEPIKDAEGKPVAPAAENQRYIDIDPAKVMESAKKLDFAKIIPQDQFAAVAQGGDAAVAALTNIINTLGQTLYAQSAITSANLTERSLGTAQERFEKSIPDHIKRQQVSDTLRTDNPIFSNPAVQPMLQMLESQLTSKHPNATVAEIQQSAKKYLEAFAGELSGKAEANRKGPQVPKSEDWDSFFSGNN